MRVKKILALHANNKMLAVRAHAEYFRLQKRVGVLREPRSGVFSARPYMGEFFALQNGAEGIGVFADFRAFRHEYFAGEKESCPSFAPDVLHLCASTRLVIT
jgi:hypothetical protein